MEDALLRTARTIGESSPTNLLALEQAQLLAVAGDTTAALDRLREGLHRRLVWAPYVAIDPAFAQRRFEGDRRKFRKPTDSFFRRVPFSIFTLSRMLWIHLKGQSSSTLTSQKLSK